MNRAVDTKAANIYIYIYIGKDIVGRGGPGVADVDMSRTLYPLSWQRRGFWKRFIFRSVKGIQNKKLSNWTGRRRQLNARKCWTITPRNAPPGKALKIYPIFPHFKRSNVAGNTTNMKLKCNFVKL